MRIYIDCEFNGLGGSLISMALVTESGDEWYEVLELPEGETLDPWVAEHVMPLLGKEPISADEFRAKLHSFLRQFDGCEAMGDWPADFEHLCSQMSFIGADLGFWLPIECSMHLIKGSPEIKSKIPHHALSDARALRDWHQSTLMLRDDIYK